MIRFNKWKEKTHFL